MILCVMPGSELTKKSFIYLDNWMISEPFATPSGSETDTPAIVDTVSNQNWENSSLPPRQFHSLQDESQLLLQGIESSPNQIFKNEKQESDIALNPSQGLNSIQIISNGMDIPSNLNQQNHTEISKGEFHVPSLLSQNSETIAFPPLGDNSLTNLDFTQFSNYSKLLKGSDSEHSQNARKRRKLVQPETTLPFSSIESAQSFSLPSRPEVTRFPTYNAIASNSSFQSIHSSHLDSQLPLGHPPYGRIKDLASFLDSETFNPLPYSLNLPSPIPPAFNFHFPNPDFSFPSFTSNSSESFITHLNPFSVISRLPNPKGLIPEPVLKQTLIEFADAIATDNQAKANTLLPLLQRETSRFGSVMQRLCYFFIHGLRARVLGTGSKRFKDPPEVTPLELELAMGDFFSKLPHIKYCVTAVTNTIFESVRNHDKVHVIELGMTQVGQISTLMKMLCQKRRRISLFRYSSVSNGNSCSEEYQKEITLLANQLNIQFEFNWVNVHLEGLKVPMLNLRVGEAVAVCCCLELHHLMDASVMRFSPRDVLIRTIKEINPKIFCMVELDADFNGPFFMARFKECLDFHIATFDSHDAMISRESRSRALLEKQIMGRTIINVVACEGTERKIRTERLEQWQTRMQNAGFLPVSINASTQMKLLRLLQNYPGDFSSSVSNGVCLISWKGRSSVFTAAWH